MYRAKRQQTKRKERVTCVLHVDSVFSPGSRTSLPSLGPTSLCSNGTSITWTMEKALVQPHL
jgi:hypothetical protein